MIYSINTKA